MNGKNEASIYIHIPFCIRKCVYCSFYVIPYKEPYANQYKDLLICEWNQEKHVFNNSCIKSIFFGGGSPSCVPPEIIRDVISTIHHSNDAEITIEVNPEHVSLETAHKWKLAGVTRVSLGVQSFDNHILSLLSRRHSCEEAIQAIHTIKDAGIDNISLDLMYDIPGQTVQSWLQTLEIVEHLPITHISIYNLTIDPHTSFFKNKSKIIHLLPSEEESSQMLDVCCNVLSQNGFIRYEISAFAKHGYESYHNIGYWTGRPFLGLGPSAASFTNNLRYTNKPNFNKYCRNIRAGLPAEKEVDQISSESRLKELLALNLRIIKGTNISNYNIKYLQNILNDLQKLDLIEVDNDSIKLSNKGLRFHDSVAEIIMQSRD